MNWMRDRASEREKEREQNMYKMKRWAARTSSAHTRHHHPLLARATRPQQVNKQNLNKNNELSMRALL